MQKLPSEIDSLASATNPVAVGPSGWSYPHWEGVIYPRRKPRHFHPLEIMAERFDAVEISSSFETPVRPELARLWLEKVDFHPGFQFTARLHKSFTQDRILTSDAVEHFSEGLRVLKRARRFGALLLQFPWAFRYTRENREYFIQLRRAFAEFPLVAEMRHSSWMSQEALGTLIDYRAGFCNLDQPEQIKTMPPTAFLTSGIGYVRLHGDGYTPAQLAEWQQRISHLRSFAERTFVVFTNDAAGQSFWNSCEMSRLLQVEPAPWRRKPASSALRETRSLFAA